MGSGDAGRRGVSSTAAADAPWRVLSGIQPTGVPHLGNYLGAIANWVEIQDTAVAAGHGPDAVLLSVVDLHSITMPHDAAALPAASLATAASLIACGIDPEKSTLFRQGAVAQHTELSWVLGCLTPMGWLNRMTQFKDKSKGKQSAASLGLFAYPVLQAADILVYKATWAFNSQFCPPGSAPCFPLPEAQYVAGRQARLMSLRTGTTKMSKSDPSPGSRIDLTDSADEIRKKISKAVTDSEAGITFDPERRPGVANLLSILAALRDEEPEAIAAEMAEAEASRLKGEVIEAVEARVGPIRTRINALLADPAYLTSVLEQGEARARGIAAATMTEVKGLVGLSHQPI